VAKTGNAEASVARRDGVISGFARAPGVIFADARPPANDSGVLHPRVLGVTQQGRSLRAQIAWQVLQPLGAEYRPFIHFVDEKVAGNEGITFQGGIRFDAEKASQSASFVTTVEATLPENIVAPASFALRYGFYDPKGGGRLRLAGATDATGRAKGGRIHVDIKEGKPLVSYEAEGADPTASEREARLNTKGTVVKFGPVATNGAFRLKHTGSEWELTPLPNSRDFSVALNLNELGAANRQVASIKATDINGRATEDIKFESFNVGMVVFRAGGAFAYRIRLK
jgi:hypothetical protein